MTSTSYPTRAQCDRVPGQTSVSMATQLSLTGWSRAERVPPTKCMQIAQEALCSWWRLALPSSSRSPVVHLNKAECVQTLAVHTDLLYWPYVKRGTCLTLLRKLSVVHPRQLNQWTSWWTTSRGTGQLLRPWWCRLPWMDFLFKSRLVSARMCLVARACPHSIAGTG